MSAKLTLPLRDVRRVFRLIGEIREQGSDPAHWRPHMVKRLSQLFSAEVVISSEIHFRKSPGSNTMRVIDIGWACHGSDTCDRIHTEREGETPDAYWVSAGQPLPAAQSDAEQLVPVKPARPLYGGTSFIMSQIALPHIGAVDQLGMHRIGGDQPFTPVEHRLVHLFHVELGRLWRKDALAKAQDPHADLPPRLSQTLAALSEGLSEKQIAIKLQLSQHTIHNYIKALHQRFEVSSRGELLAKAGKAKTNFLPKLSM